MLYAEVVSAAAAGLALAVAGYGTGRIVAAKHELSDWEPEKAALETLLGMGLNALALFLTGIFYWRPITVIALLALPFLVGLRALFRLRISFAGLPRTALAATLAILLICFLGSFAKPVGDIGNDTISYHLLGPKTWKAEGAIRPVLDHSHTAMPATVETLFAAGMLISNDRSAGFIDMVFFALLLLQVAGFTRKLGGGTNAMAIAVLLTAAMPLIADFSNNGFVDLAYACFALAAIRFVVWGPKINSPAVFGGIFTGLCLGTKYNGLFLAAILIAVYLFDRRDSAQRAAFWMFPLAAVLVGGGWYLRNWIVLGSPVYPIPQVLAGFFHSATFPPAAIEGFQEYIAGRGKGAGRGFGYFLALPFTLTYFTAAFHGAGGIGLAPLGLGPAGLYKVWNRRAVRTLAAILFFFTLSWYVTQQESRFLIPVVCVFASLAGIGAEWAWSTASARRRILIGAIIAISVIYGSLVILTDERPRLLWLKGPAADLAAQATKIPYRTAFQYLNQTDAVKRVLILDKLVPTYYLNKPYVKVLGPYGEVPDPSLTSPHVALQETRRLGISHILMVTPDLDLPAGTNCDTPVFQSPDARVYSCH